MVLGSTILSNLKFDTVVAREISPFEYRLSNAGKDKDSSIEPKLYLIPFVAVMSVFLNLLIPKLFAVACGIYSVTLILFPFFSNSTAIGNL